MIGRRQLPAWSPLSLGALARGLVGGLRPAVARAELDTLLAADLGTEGVLLVDSGTSALALAMRAAGADPGRPPRVALPGYGCFDLATAALGAGAEVVLYDLDSDTLGPETGSLDRAIAHGVDAVVVAHLYGVPVSVRAVRERIATVGSEGLVIEDAAQGIGAIVDGGPAGTAGDLGILSFGRGKGWIGGRGGALLAVTPRGREAMARLDLPREGGRGWGVWPRLLAQWALGRPALYGIPASIPALGLGETPFHPPHAPRGISGVAAAVAVATRAASAREAAHRRVTGAGWLTRLAPVPEVGTPGATLGEGCAAGWLRLPVLVPEGVARRLRSPAARRLGIMPGYPAALQDLEGFPVVAALPADATSRDLPARLFTLPTHSRVTERDADGCRETLSLRERVARSAG